MRRHHASLHRRVYRAGAVVTGRVEVLRGNYPVFWLDALDLVVRAQELYKLLVIEICTSRQHGVIPVVLELEIQVGVNTSEPKSRAVVAPGGVFGVRERAQMNLPSILPNCVCVRA